jgi:hypothetical protein
MEKDQNKLALPSDQLHGVPDSVGPPENRSGRKALGVRRSSLPRLEEWDEYNVRISQQ